MPIVFFRINTANDAIPTSLVLGYVVCDFVEKQVWTPPADVHGDVVPDLPLEEAALRRYSEEGVCRGEKVGKEDAAIDAVHVEEVKFDLVRGALGGGGVVYY